jgi:hypothetical protein
VGVIEYTPEVLNRFEYIYRTIIRELGGKGMFNRRTGEFSALPNVQGYNAKKSWGDFCRMF